MMRQEIKVLAEKAPFTGQVELLIAEASGSKRSTGRLTFEALEEDQTIEPTTKISLSAAQELMDDLWRAGLRPSEGAGSAGAMRATERHLEDLRKIAGKKLGVDL